MSIETPEALEIRREEHPGGKRRLRLYLGEQAVSGLWVIPFTIRVGRARVRMDGIGGVGTDATHRNRGYSRRVLEETVRLMRSGDAALSMLYGIQDFYPKFGFATVGPEHFLELTELHRPAPLPLDWQARPFRPADLASIEHLYHASCENAVGPAVRTPECEPWLKLATPADTDGPDACRVVTDPDGRVRGYVWRAGWCWSVRQIERREPEALILGEAVADSPLAADAVLAVCRQWAQEEGARRNAPIRKVMLALPPEGPVAEAAMHQYARCVQAFEATGGSMARVLSVPRLLAALLPELEARLAASGEGFWGVLRLRTDLEDAWLAVAPTGVTTGVGDDPPPGETLDVFLPQATLARLALGAFPPDDLLARLERPVDGRAADLLRVLFPRRLPHMSFPDRY